MQRETAKLARAIEKSLAQGANDALLDAFKGIDTGRLSQGARQAGDKWASAFERQVSRGLKDLGDELPTFEPKANLDKFDKALAETKKELAELAKSRISPGQGDTGGLDALSEKLDGITQRMTRMSDEAEDADRKLQLRGFARQAELLRGLVDDAAAEGDESGRRFGGAFADQAARVVQQALRNLPGVQVGGED